MRLPTRHQLSKEQENIYLVAPLTGTTIITGPPGTGKSVLAVYRAKLLHKQNNNFDLVMFNNVLKQYTAQSFEENELQNSIRTWHSWLYRWWKNANSYGAGLPEIEPYVPNFIEIFKLLPNVKDKAKLGWNHLIVDEGQDFPPDFYMLLRIIQFTPDYGASTTKALTILADENQRLESGRNSKVMEICTALNIPRNDVYKLNINFRNTKQIATLSKAFHLGLGDDLAALPERNGELPVIEQFNCLENEVDKIFNYALMNEDLDIGVFLKDRKLMKIFYSQLHARLNNKMRVQKYETRNSELVFNSEGSITLLCDKSVKGVEFDTVFVPQLQHYSVEGIHEDFLKMLFYVISSRARTGLHFSFTNADHNPEVLVIFPERDSGLIEYRGF